MTEIEFDTIVTVKEVIVKELIFWDCPSCGDTNKREDYSKSVGVDDNCDRCGLEIYVDG